MKRLLVATLVASLVGCAAGPNYRRPDVATPVAYREGGIDWQAVKPDASTAASGPWWARFGDPVLDELEARVAVSNESLKAAAAAYEQAQAALRASRASYWPVLSVSGGETRGSRGGGATTNLTTASASASWEPDLWGRVRRGVEASRAQAAASADTLAATRLSLQALLATDYLELRVQDRIRDVLDRAVQADQQALQIAENRYKAGVAARADVVTARTQLLSVQAQQINAGILRAQLEHAIAVLVGQPPAAFDLGKAPLSDAVPTIPMELPSALLQRRPDVAASERQVVAANAQIGVATSAWFPNLTLSANGSYTNSLAASLFSLPNRVWSVGPSLAETLFDGGTRRAHVAQARAARDQSAAQYRGAVLAAFQQVEDALVNLRILGEQAAVQEALVKSAHEAESLTLNQYKAGTVPYSSLISAQTATLSAEQSALQVLRSRLTGTVGLVSALGGDWHAGSVNGQGG